MGKKYVYLFSEGNASMRELLGGKGANLAEMTNIGLPVPQGFTITTEACTQYYEDGRPIFNSDSTYPIEYDRLGARDIMFKISIKNAAATATYQNNVNDKLDMLFDKGAINIIQYLQNLNEPFADKLLQDVQSNMEELRAQQEAMGQQAPQNGVVPEANQQAVEQAQGYLMQ